MSKQFKKPNCPDCKKPISPAGGIVVSETDSYTTDWACWDCDTRIEDQEPTGVYDLPEQSEMFKQLEKVIEDIDTSDNFTVIPLNDEARRIFNGYPVESYYGSHKTKRQ